MQKCHVCHWAQRLPKSICHCCGGVPNQFNVGRVLDVRRGTVRRTVVMEAGMVMGMGNWNSVVSR